MPNIERYLLTVTQWIRLIYADFHVDDDFVFQSNAMRQIFHFYLVAPVLIIRLCNRIFNEYQKHIPHTTHNSMHYAYTLWELFHLASCIIPCSLFIVLIQCSRYLRNCMSTSASCVAFFLCVPFSGFAFVYYLFLLLYVVLHFDEMVKCVHQVSSRIEMLMEEYISQ